jgi:hypothetical protein
MRIKLSQWCKDMGIEAKVNAKGQVCLNESPELMAELERYVSDSVIPALCDEGCEVEPDGMCEHGAPSILIACHIC